jgi:hypothetical protein
MVSPLHDPFATKREYAPVRYDLALDPEHARLREVNEQDLERLDRLKDAEPRYDQLTEVWRQAYRWKWRNQVSDPVPELCASDADGSPGTGFAWVPAEHGKCFVCFPSRWPPRLWNTCMRSGQFSMLGQHCAAHAAAYHAWVPSTWHCCDPPYDPATAYAWRLTDPWRDRRED